MGIFGVAAYAYYRIKTVIPFVKKFSFDKTMIALPILITIGASLLDNFIFYFYTAFLYMLLLAIVFRMHSNEKAPAEDSTDNA